MFHFVILEQFQLYDCKCSQSEFVHVVLVIFFICVPSVAQPSKASADALAEYESFDFSASSGNRSKRARLQQQQQQQRGAENGDDGDDDAMDASSSSSSSSAVAGGKANAGNAAESARAFMKEIGWKSPTSSSSSSSSTSSSTARTLHAPVAVPAFDYKKAAAEATWQKDDEIINLPSQGHHGNYHQKHGIAHGAASRRPEVGLRQGGNRSMSFSGGSRR